MKNSTSLSSIALLLAIAACGGGNKGAGGGGVGNGTGADPEPAGELAPGGTGFPGLDWGDTPEAVKADYPDAQGGGDELELRMKHGGRDAVVSLTFAGGTDLISIGVSYQDGFDSMPECGETFAQVRAELDKALGESSEDNLAAYWNTDSAAVILYCEFSEEGGEAASMSASYSLPESDE